MTRGILKVCWKNKYIRLHVQATLKYSIIGEVFFENIGIRVEALILCIHGIKGRTCRLFIAEKYWLSSGSNSWLSYLLQFATTTLIPESMQQAEQ